MFNNIFFKFFASAFIVLIAFSASIYFTITPAVTKKLIKIEENTGITTLRHIIKIIDNYSHEIENYNTLYLEDQKKKLKALVALQESYIQEVYKDVQAGLLTEEEGKRRVIERTKNFSYGKDGYLFLANTNYKIISHPDPKLHNKAEQLIDIYGKEIISSFVNIAMRDGEGFTTYWWKKENASIPSEKLTYAKLFKAWNWIIGTGIYIDDVEKTTQIKREKAVEELRELIHSTKIGKTGYLYIFDPNMNMIIHPNSNIENTNFSTLLNPLTKNSIGRDLMNSIGSDKEYGVLEYKWDSIKDPGNYVYDKVAWIKFIPDFNWYIASSVYTEEFKSSANILKDRIISDTLIVSFIIFLFIFFAIRTITNPIKKLSLLMEKVHSGDLNVKSNINRNDEIGTLAKGFDSMIETIQDHIHTLDLKVEERTLEVENKNTQLKMIISELQETEKALTHASITDELTGIYNRKKIHQELESNVKLSNLNIEIFSIIFFDIDKFKSINDNYGHLTGDYVLQEIANLTKETLKEDFCLGRYGGEEFIIIAPNTTLHEATEFAESLRKAIEEHNFKDNLHITSSFGVATHLSNESQDDLIKRADDFLYKAKDLGRNRVLNS